MEHSIDDLNKALDDTVNRGDPKNKKRGTVVGANLPDRSKWNARLAAHAPGCGSPIRVPGTNGGRMNCGSKLDGDTQLCPHCEAKRVVETLLA